MAEHILICCFAMGDADSGIDEIRRHIIARKSTEDIQHEKAEQGFIERYYAFEIRSLTVQIDELILMREWLAHEFFESKRMTKLYREELNRRFPNYELNERKRIREEIDEICNQSAVSAIVKQEEVFKKKRKK